MQRCYLRAYLKSPDQRPTVEDELIAAEEMAMWREALGASQSQLSRIQQRWLDTFREDIEKHGSLNLARAGRALSRSRSDATEALLSPAGPPAARPSVASRGGLTSRGALSPRAARPTPRMMGEGLASAARA